MGNFLKILSVFLSSATFFGKVGMPSAVILFEFDFIKVFAVTVSGGFFGNVVFTFLSAALLKWWNNFKDKQFGAKKVKHFTKGNRRIIRIKHRFGLAGIAALTPILFSIPLGAFLAERFYKDKSKVILYLTISVVAWNVILYFVYYFFYDSLKGWFI
ncbi:MAG: hypothetical protein ACK50A_08170 [Sphingobacteriaceae bacterium]